MNFLPGFLAGLATSIISQALWDWYQRAGKRALGRVARRLAKKQVFPTGFLRIGFTVVPWVVASYGPYSCDNIRTFYNPHPIKKPPEIQELYNLLMKDIKRREAKGEAVPFNGLGYQLEKFFVGGRTGLDEEPILTLHFRPTDYFSMLVTDNRLDEPIIVNNTKTTLRERYAHSVDLAYSPIPEFATHFGVGLMIITSDNKIIFSERGPTAVDAFAFFPSVAEEASRPVDAGQNGAPDPYRTAVRGILEELGIEVSADKIRFLSFGANAVLCEYALCGVVQTEQSEAEIIALRSLGVPKDRWESQKLHFVRFTPEDVARFMASHKPWSPFAVVRCSYAL